jgi:signal transduction histidine kinase
VPAKYKVVVIDDEEIVLDSCREILAGEEYEIATAPDASTGLKVVREYQPALVLVDLKMPGMSGFELLEAIRQLDPRMVSIVITGYATVESAVEAMKKGAYDFLPKPFSPDELRLIVRRGIEKHKLVLETIALRHEKEMLRRNFAAVVSHELKAPLAALQQQLYALSHELAGTLTEQQRARLERMKTRLDDLLKMIHTWLRVITVDITRIRDSFQPVLLRTVLAKAVESVQPFSVRQDVAIDVVCPVPELKVNGDEGTLVEAVTNLLSNAIKFSHPGSRVVARAQPSNQHVAISVTDSGVGIAEEELPFLFNGFRGQKAPDGERGAGLGLAITRRIVEAHGGTITVQSALGKGSTFIILLPACGPVASEHSHTELEVLAGSTKGGVV